MARAAVIPQSPPKRTTRTRTKATTSKTSSKAGPKTTTKAKAPTSATEARKRGARTTSASTSKPTDDESDESTDDEIGMVTTKEKTSKTTTKAKGRPTTKASTGTTGRGRKPAAAVEPDSDNDDELAQTDAPKKRGGRPKATPAKTTETSAPKTRGRPKGSAAGKASTKLVDPVKENTRLNAKGFTDMDFSSSQEAPRHVYIATNSTSNSRSNMLRGPAKKKTVTFKDPGESDDDLSEPSPPIAGRRRGTILPGRQAGLASKPVRKPAARGRKPMAAANKEGPKPLSPKKATQVAKALSSYASSDGEDDELSGDKDQIKFVVDSPQRLNSPVKKINITGKFRKSLDENGEPLPGPRLSIDFNDTLLMSSPARRPPPSPFNFSMRETPKRGGFTLGEDAKALSQLHLSPTHNSPLKFSPRKAHIETPKRGGIFMDHGKSMSQPNFTPGHNSPLKSSPRKGLFGASFVSQSQAHDESTSTPMRHSRSFLHSPAKKIASPFKSSLLASRNSVREESQTHASPEGFGTPATPATPDVDESPLRTAEIAEDMEVESEGEQDEEALSEGDEEEDVTREVHAQSPAVAEDHGDDTVHGEADGYDSEETLEYEQEDEDMTAVVDHKAEFAEDEDAEDEREDVEDLEDPLDGPVDEVDEGPGEEDFEDPVEELVEVPAEEPNEEPTEEPVDELADETEEEPMEEPIDVAEEPAAEPTAEGLDDQDISDEDGEEIADELDVDPTTEPLADDVEDEIAVEEIADHKNAPNHGSLEAEEQPDEEGQLKQLEQEVDEEFKRESFRESTARLRKSLVEGLEDVFVEPPVAESGENRDDSETEDELEMQEAGENAADLDDGLDEQDMDDDAAFDEDEPTLATFEATIQISPNRVPIQPYEVEEPEDCFSPTRQVYYRFRRVLSPVRVLEGSPVQQRHMSPARFHLHKTERVRGISQGLFQEPKQATPRRRLSTRRALFENAPRFTPLAQQFSQWKASSPEKAQPRRSRRSVFSLGGGLGKSSEVASTPEEVSYPDVSDQVQSEAPEEEQPSEVPEEEELTELPDQDAGETLEVPHEEASEVLAEVAEEPADVVEEEPTEVAEEATEVQYDAADEETAEAPELANEEPTEVAEEATEMQYEMTNDEAAQEAEGPQIYEDPDSQSTMDGDETEESREPMAEMIDQPQTDMDDGNGETENDLGNTSVSAHEPQIDMGDVSESKENTPDKTSVSNNPPHDTQGDENKENANIPVLAPFTPIKNRFPPMQTVHTVSKVPLKPEGQISPLKISRKRGLSLSGPSPGRSSRLRTSDFAPVQGNAPSISPRKSPRVAARRSLNRSEMQTQAAMEEQRPASAKRPAQSPSPTKRSVQAPSSTKRPIQAPSPTKQPAQAPSSTKKSKPSRKSTGAPPRLALQGAVVYVDVHTTEGEDASGIFVELLQQMGARCVMKWSWNPRASQSPEEEGKVGITHVIFKDGGVRTLEKVRHARGVVKCVGVGWVLDCERENKWLDESHYEVDSSIIPRGGAKRRKSMEPRALSNVNGTLIKADTAAANRRRSGIDRTAKETFTRDTTPTLPEESSSTTPDTTPTIGAGHPEADQEYCHTPKTPGYTFDMDAIGMSPATPFYLSQRTKLVQQTCPPKQIRQGLFTTPAQAKEPNQKLRAKLEAARRKSMAYKPRVGSPLVE
ncbi:hypothetical protein BO71DRAFT_439022 [Aspergillus ellipticus CBS 707.79]|uniref:BRCT domain-containing protein n=1 Tax=Aspergillus ellipticus CBS 707.79 TaxID=1448320 RepID=A0A319EZ28_9EURO|nr:hypothetical protein BO71DRAFT_439022 [Aspergillus ellipticus CBS 707.79]